MLNVAIGCYRLPYLAIVLMNYCIVVHIYIMSLHIVREAYYNYDVQVIKVTANCI